MYSDELVVFEVPSSVEQAEKMLEDLLEHDAALMENDATTSKETKKRQQTIITAGRIHGNKNEGIDDQSKKIMHREIERQRRQEMAELHASLRSLLPLQYIKGKRAISDHMHEAVNYIEHLQTNIKDLQMKRDRLKKYSPAPTNNYLSGTINSCCCSNGEDGFLMSPSCSSCSSSYNVTVSPCQDGLEILISGSNADDGFPISRVLVELLGRGINPVTIDSTRVNQKSLHKIQTQANDHITSLDLSELQDSLTNILKVLIT